MKTCNGCRYFQSVSPHGTEPGSVRSQCHVYPPEYRSAKEQSHRPRVAGNDNACIEFRAPMPDAANIPPPVRTVETITLAIDATAAIQQIKKAMGLGYCPQCWAAGETREKRPNGNDKCVNGHVYPSSSALKCQPKGFSPDRVATLNAPAAPKPFICCEHDADCERVGKPCADHRDNWQPALAPKVGARAPAKPFICCEWPNDRGCRVPCLLHADFVLPPPAKLPPFTRLGLHAITDDAFHESAVSRNGPKLYCYAPQYIAIIAMFAECGMQHAPLHRVSDTLTLRGIRGGVFIHVDGHNESVPVAMFENLRSAGLLCITVSDSWMRAKLERLGGRRA